MTPGEPRSAMPQCHCLDILGPFLSDCQDRSRGLRFPPMNEALGYFLGKPRANLNGRGSKHVKHSALQCSENSSIRPVSCLGTGSVLILPAPPSPLLPLVIKRLLIQVFQDELARIRSNRSQNLTQCTHFSHISHMADLGLNFVRKTGSLAHRSAKSSKASLMLSFFTKASSNNSKAGANRRPSPKT